MTTQATDITYSSGLRGRLAGFFAAIVRGYEAFETSASRLNQIQALEAKSDADLAALGIKRDEIVRYVFRDVFYL